MTSADTVMLTGPPDRRHQPQRALVLLEQGEAVGGYRDARQIDSVQALLTSPVWKASREAMP